MLVTLASQSITDSMRAALRHASAACIIGWLLFGLVPSGLAADGTFEGLIVDAPREQPLPHGWIYVMGRNRLLRRVEVAHAAITFGGQVPASQRRKCGPECLEQGIEVRVTAAQDASGEWRAKQVEILRMAKKAGLNARMTN